MTCSLCSEPAQLRNPHSEEPDRYWPWCFDHLIEESIRLDKLRRANELHACQTAGCVWPATLGGICVRCAAKDAEALYLADKKRRKNEALTKSTEEEP